MGLLVNGEWVDRWYDTASTGGNFVRTEAQFRNWITADGRPGPSGDGGFDARPGRYRLFVSLACPWAHRTLILRTLKGLDESIAVSVVHPYMGSSGWTFEPAPGVVADPHGARYLYEVYLRAQPRYSGRVTVPLLWDDERATIVNNESSEILRMLNSAFDDVGAKPGDYSPTELRGAIDEVNARVYGTVNNGVYKAGFATEQPVYEREVRALFAALDGRQQLATPPEIAELASLAAGDESGERAKTERLVPLRQIAKAKDRRRMEVSMVTKVGDDLFGPNTR